jgi:hypothetical protein
MNSKLLFGIFIALLCLIGIGVYLWHDITTFKKSLSSDPQMEGKQERTDRVPSTATGEPHKDSAEPTPVETPEQVEREVNEIIEHLEALHAPAEEDEENPTEQPADSVAAAWAHLESISQNPQEWGEFSPEAAELMAQLTPTWIFDYEADGEGPAEDAMMLLKKLVSFQDPRSAEVIANYINAGFGLSTTAVVAVGPPLVPPLIPLLDADTRFEGRLMSVRILGILAEKHRHELGGAVEHIILPKLEQMATSDPSPVVQRRAREAVARLR